MINKGIKRIIGSFNNTNEPGEGTGNVPSSTSTTTQASTSSTQQETTTTQPASSNNNDNNDNNDNNSDEEDVLIEEESFLPLIFNGENNIYTSQYYGFGNLFSPHTEIYNY